MRPKEGGHPQVLPRRGADRGAEPNLLSEEAKAAKARARRGEARPTGKETISPPGADSPQPAAAPAFGTNFVGVPDTEMVPPDSQIAAGPNNVVLAANGAVIFRNKNDGNRLYSQTLQNSTPPKRTCDPPPCTAGFFLPLGQEHTDVGDPWVVYDPYINRFWILAISGRTAAHSDLLIGLSNTSDATLGWWLWEFDATLDGGTDTSNWCDYPKLGFDAQAIYVTCNMLNDSGDFKYSKVRVMTKSQFVNNTKTLYWWDFTDIREGNPFFCLFDLCTKAETIQPAQMFGASASTGEFLVNAYNLGGIASTLDVWRITNAAECCDGDATGPTLSHNSHGVGDYGPAAGARQSGSTTRIDTGDSRLLYAFWRGGKLSTGQTLACRQGADACAGYTELDLSSYPTISTVNDWALQTAGVDFFYPAVAANARGYKTMVYSRSSSSEFASARFVGIPPSSVCTFCFDGPETILRPGGAVYVDLLRGKNRWGDYSGASPDPNGQGVWIAGELATTNPNQWSVRAGLTYQDAPLPLNDNFSRAQSLSGSNTSVTGTTRFATREPPEPDHYVTNPPDSNRWVGDHSVWYSWEAPSYGPVVVNTCQAKIDSILAVYTGSSLGSLNRVADNNNACSSGWGSKLNFNAVEGTTYSIAVGDAGGLRESTFTLTLS
jgi:hypothetical protein